MRKIHLTCSLCTHFDSNREVCGKQGIETFAQNRVEPIQCKNKGYYTRDLNVQYTFANFFSEIDETTSYIEDLSYLPRDKNGVPLFVLTKRGIERALPAYDGLNLTSDPILGVKRAFTFQGQRELIYELGVELARHVCDSLGIKLIVLPNEIDYKGHDQYKLRFSVYERQAR